MQKNRNFYGTEVGKEKTLVGLEIRVEIKKKKGEGPKLRLNLSVIIKTGWRVDGGNLVTSLAILVACLTCNIAGVTSKPERFLPLMFSS